VPRGLPPPELWELLTQPNPCVIATIRPDGDLHTVPTWYEWLPEGAVLVNLDESRRRLAHMRADPRVAVTILDGERWTRHLSVIGSVTEIRPDVDLADIDRLSRHYIGAPYPDRGRPRWTAVITISRWHGWESGHDLTGVAPD
jgi:PPOX class probable F420-dependent enzyme